MAIVLAAPDERAAHRIYNVGEPETLSVEAWVRQIADAVGWSGAIVRVPEGRLQEPLALGVDAAQHIVVSSERLHQELGYQEIIPLDEALRRTITWERANPPAQVDAAIFDYELEDRIFEEMV